MDTAITSSKAFSFRLQTHWTTKSRLAEKEPSLIQETAEFRPLVSHAKHPQTESWTMSSHRRTNKSAKAITPNWQEA
jgi:hypothetical protein